MSNFTKAYVSETHTITQTGIRIPSLHRADLIIEKCRYGISLIFWMKHIYKG